MTYTATLQQVVPVGWLRLIPLLPLLGAVVNGLFGRALQARFGRRAVHGVAIAAMLGATVAALTAVAMLMRLPPDQRYLHDAIAPLVHVGKLRADLALAIDPLSGLLVAIITVIGSAIHVYSVGYMAEEPSYWRFFAYLNLFVFSMLLLVLGDSFLLLFFGWEGVGLCSYLLIGFWYREPANGRAGMKAFVVNRIGDWGFLVGLALLFWGLGGSWSRIDQRYYSDVAAHDAPPYVAVTAPGAHDPAAGRVPVVVGPTVVFRELHDQLAVTAADGTRPLAGLLTSKRVLGVPLVFVVALCLFIGAAGKSAQLPLYVWLPDAMAGPTPVSALIHAATMVTAGVYLIVRLNFLFVLSPGALTVVACVGALTALYAATIALFQHDIKKVLAYSTVSQLGFMFVAVGVGAFWAGAFHLLTHACFKACLFLGAGSLIHGMHRLTHARQHAHGGQAHDGDDDHAPAPSDPRLAPDPTDPQDLRNMGGLGALMPTTRWTYFVASCAIAGFPPFAGFFSKDELLARALGNRLTLVPGALIWALSLAAALCTAFYVFRSYYLAFAARPASEEQRRTVHESPRSMTSVLVLLAVLCIVIGAALGLPAAFGAGEPLLARWLEPVTELGARTLPAAHESRALELALMALSVAVALAGWAAARALYHNLGARERTLAALRERFSGLHALVYDKYRVDELYDRVFVRGFGAVARALAWLDVHVIDGVVNGLARVARAIAWLSGAFDRYVVDGAVNGLAATLVQSGRELRRAQTGRINNYVFGVAVGVVILIVLTTWL